MPYMYRSHSRYQLRPATYIKPTSERKSKELDSKARRLNYDAKKKRFTTCHAADWNEIADVHRNTYGDGLLYADYVKL